MLTTVAKKQVCMSLVLLGIFLFPLGAKYVYLRTHLNIILQSHFETPRGDNGYAPNHRQRVGTWIHFHIFYASYTSRGYNWIDHGLQSEPMLAFSLWLSDFKTKTSFGFLVKNQGSFF